MHVGRDFGSNALDGTIPAALSALNKLSFLCARHARRRTAERVPSPHVAVSTLAAAPRSGPAPVSFAVPLACS